MKDWRAEHELWKAYEAQAVEAQAEADAAMRRYARLMDMANQHKGLMVQLLEIEKSPQRADSSLF